MRDNGFHAWQSIFLIKICSLISLLESPCDSQPCRNKGKCRNVGNDFKCKCPPKFGGKRCQVKSNNGKTCIYLIFNNMLPTYLLR